MRGFLRNNSPRFIALLVVLGAFVYYFFEHPEMLKNLREVSPKHVFIMVVIDSLFFLSNAMILKVLLESFKRDLPFRECLAISSLAVIGNFLTVLRGGTIGKAVYLRKIHDFPYMTFIAAVSAISLINLSLAALMGAVAILVIGYKSHPLLLLILCFFVAMNVLFCMLFIFSSWLESRMRKKFHRISDIVKGLNLIRRNRGLVMKVSFLLLVNLLLSMAELVLSYSAFSIDVTILQAVLIDVISMFSGIIKLVPANLGIYEGSIALGSQLLGIGFQEGLLAAGLVRVVSMSVVFLLGAVFGSRLLREKTNSNVADSVVAKKSTV